jgi:hypothetical protein
MTARTDQFELNVFVSSDSENENDATAAKKSAKKTTKRKKLEEKYPNGPNAEATQSSAKGEKKPKLKRVKKSNLLKKKFCKILEI